MPRLIDVDRFWRRGALPHGRGRAGRRRGEGGPGHEAQRHQREHRDGNGGDGNGARRDALDDNSWSMAILRFKCTTDRRRWPPHRPAAQHAERQEQASVSRGAASSVSTTAASHAASRATGTRARRNAPRGEREQPLGKRWHTSQPRVGGLTCASSGRAPSRAGDRSTPRIARRAAGPPTEEARHERRLDPLETRTAGTRRRARRAARVRARASTSAPAGVDERRGQRIEQREPRRRRRAAAPLSRRGPRTTTFTRPRSGSTSAAPLAGRDVESTTIGFDDRRRCRRSMPT